MPLQEKYEIKRNPFHESGGVKLYYCTDRRTGEQWVAKVFDKSRLNERQLKRCLHEASIGMSIPPHPSIVRIVEMDEDEKQISLIMENLKGGSLFQHIVAHGAVNEKRAKKLIKQVLNGLIHLHGQGISHRDLKPENLLFRTMPGGPSEELCIADFGLATEGLGSECVGSPQYMAPEVALIGLRVHESHQMKPLYNEKCDIWTVGVIAHVMLSSLLPFDGGAVNDVLKDVVRNQIRWDHPIWRQLSARATDFVKSLTQTNPSARPSAKEALRHPWLTQ